MAQAVDSTSWNPQGGGKPPAVSTIHPDWNWNRWAIHAWAALGSACVFGILLLGGSVTSYDVGMAVPDAPTTFGENVFTYSWWRAPFGVQLEHSHRLMGYVVGISAIGLVATLALWESRKWVRSLGYLALALIVAQGMLGRYRVELNAILGRELAAMHGVLAQGCFACLVVLWHVTSRRFCLSSAVPHEQAASLRGSALLFLLLLGVQLTLGAMVRHLGIAFLWHVGLAIALVLVLLWQSFVVLLDETLRRALGRTTGLLLALVAGQALLGLAVWLVVGVAPPGLGPPARALSAWLATSHLAVGSLIVAAATVLLCGTFGSLAPLAGANVDVRSAPRTVELPA